jgi:energy-coupling factor transport system ATP-binding protein
MSTILRVRDFSYTYPGSEKSILRNIHLEIDRGGCYCLTGPTGSGKTTLALALKGLLEKDGRAGRITGPAQPDEGDSRVGLVLQNPETQLLATTVGAEVAFGLENLCVEPAAMPARVETALSLVALDKPLDYPVARLSMGQKYRLLIAALLVMEPHLLILDEPAAQLDPEGLTAVHAILVDLKQRGVAVVLCEHRPGPFMDLVDRFWRLDGRGCLFDGRWQAPVVSFPPKEKAGNASHAPTLLEVRELAFVGHGGIPVWDDVAFAVGRGRRIVVTGLNGTGKTTLLRVLAGFLKPTHGSVRVFDAEPLPRRLRRRLGCLFQNPQKQIFENTVREELAFPLKRFGWPSRDRADRIKETLRLCGIEHLIDHSPHKLSYGQKHLVAIASVLAPAPEMLLLDDPFAGLDGERRRDVMEILAHGSRERGMTLVWTSHDPGDIPALADGHLHIEGGRIDWR